MTVRLHKHEKFESLMKAFNHQERRDGNVKEAMRNSRRYHIGPRKKRQLKSEIARKHAKSFKRNQRERKHKAKMRKARHIAF